MPTVASKVQIPPILMEQAARDIRTQPMLLRAMTPEESRSVLAEAIVKTEALCRTYLATRPKAVSFDDISWSDTHTRMSTGRIHEQTCESASALLALADRTYWELFAVGMAEDTAGKLMCVIMSQLGILCPSAYQPPH